MGLPAFGLLVFRLTLSVKGFEGLGFRAFRVLVFRRILSVQGFALLLPSVWGFGP